MRAPEPRASIAAALALPLLACGAPPEYSTRDGVAVYATDSGFAYSPAKIERALELVQDALRTQIGVEPDDVRGRLAELSIHHHDGVLVDAATGVQMRGYFSWPPPEIFVQVEGCIGITPIAHELTHFYEHMLTDDAEGHHPPYFGGEDSVEQTAWTNLYAEFCSSPAAAAE